MPSAKKPKSQPQQSQRHDAYTEDFRNFLYGIWKHLNLPDPTPIQYDIAHYLQHGPKRRIIEGFRGVGKSWITSAFALWRLYCDPQIKILVISASKERSDAFSTFTKRLIGEVACLKFLQPGDGQRDSTVAFDVGPSAAAHAPSVKSVGITGQITGSRANLIISDDVETPDNAYTQLQRDRLSEAVKEYDAVLSPGGEIVVLGTPQCEMSVYNTLRDRGYDARIWPVRYPPEKQIVGYRGALAPSIANALLKDPKLEGKPTEPTRFGDADLIEREASYGRSGFNLQFQLDTALSDAEKYPLKLADLIVMPLDSQKGPCAVTWGRSADKEVKEFGGVGFAGDRCYGPIFIDPKWADYEGSLLVVDPSGRGKDETGYAVTKLLMGRIYVTDFGGFSDGYSEEVLRAIAEKARDQKVGKILVESNFGDGMFSALLRPVVGKVYPCTIEEVRHNVQKEKRIIDTLEPVMNQHRLVMGVDPFLKDLKTPLVHNRLTFQLTRITRDKGSLVHDDRLDALAMGVGYWVEKLKVNTDDELAKHQQSLMDAELENFMEHAMGNLNPGERKRDPNWLNLPAR
jgi:hypothetical protein